MAKILKKWAAKVGPKMSQPYISEPQISGHPNSDADKLFNYRARRRSCSVDSQYNNEYTKQGVILECWCNML